MAKKEMEETTTTTTTVDPDGTKRTVTKVVRKTKGADERKANQESNSPNTVARNEDGTPVDGGQQSGDPNGKVVFCMPCLCTIL